MNLAFGAFTPAGLLFAILIVVGIGVASIAGRALIRFQQTPVGERTRRFHIHGSVGLVVGIIVSVWGLIIAFPHTVQRSIVPRFEYTQQGRYSTTYVVTDARGTRYNTPPELFLSLRTGSVYACQVHVYVILVHPWLVSCTATAPTTIRSS